MSQSTVRKARPLSPHLSIWRWGPHMLVSILHRMTGVVMATFGTVVFVWWLAALASGPESYGSFHYWVVSAKDGGATGYAINILARVAAIGLSYAFFQHFANGIRHLFMDLGANYELKRNKLTAIATIAFAVAATVVMWAFIFLKGA